MRVLVLNCGSSSLKFALVEVDGERSRAAPIASGAYEHIDDHRGTARRLARWLRAPDGPGVDVDATAHRVVHGGDLVDPTVVDDATLEAIRAAGALAPLHNRPALAAIEAIRDAVDRPAVAVFDTAFHRTMPPRAARYAIPTDVADRLGIRRYGFHGLAHRSMAERWAAASGRPLGETRLITCQVGSGVSLAALEEGRSVDTTMGFTPLEGLVMATRSGDLDPSIPGYLTRAAGMGLDEVDELLTTRSGLLGLSGRSSQAGELLAAEADGDAGATLALDMFCYRLRKQIGAYLVALGGADAVIFGGGIGERFPEIRARACDDMGWCGLEIDATRNERCRARDGEISAATSTIGAWVLAPDEAGVIARDAATALDAFTGRERSDPGTDRG